MLNRVMPRAILAIFIFVPVFLVIDGCCAPAPHRPPASTQPLTGLGSLGFESSVVASVDPPLGWVKQPLKSSSNHMHQIWLSPTRATAYGVVHFGIPFPVGENFVLNVFLARMKKVEGEANLISKQDDPNLPGLRFVAEGGLYRINGNLIVHAFQGWAIYAGTLRGKPVNQTELDIAELARDNTRVGTPTASARRSGVLPSPEVNSSQIDCFWTDSPKISPTTNSSAITCSQRENLWAKLPSDQTAWARICEVPIGVFPRWLDLQGQSIVCIAGKSMQASTVR